MKGICLEWSRGRHFSPSLPGDRYLKLGSKSDLRAEISVSIVWYNALARVQRYCAQFLLLMVIYGNPVFGNIVEIVKNLYYRALEYFLDPRIISNLRHGRNSLKEMFIDT